MEETSLQITQLLVGLELAMLSNVENVNEAILAVSPTKPVEATMLLAQHLEAAMPSSVVNVSVEHHAASLMKPPRVDTKYAPRSSQETCTSCDVFLTPGQDFVSIVLGLKSLVNNRFYVRAFHAAKRFLFIIFSWTLSRNFSGI